MQQQQQKISTSSWYFILQQDQKTPNQSKKRMDDRKAKVKGSCTRLHMHRMKYPLSVLNLCKFIFIKKLVTYTEQDTQDSECEENTCIDL